MEVWTENKDPRAPAFGAMIIVDFNREDKVLDKTYFPPQGSPPSLLERFIGRFK